MYSIVNQVMQTASIMPSCGLSCRTPFLSLTCRLGMVLMVIPMVDTMMKVMDMILTTFKRGVEKLRFLSHGADTWQIQLV